jgi:hypothetical protein
LRSTSIHIRCFCGEYYWDPETREAHARALFDCYCVQGNVAELELAFEDLKQVLARDDATGAATTPSRPSPETLAMLEDVRKKLRTRAVSSPTGGAGDPPAAAGDPPAGAGD